MESLPKKTKKKSTIEIPNQPPLKIFFETFPLPHLSLFLTNKLLIDENESSKNIQQEILNLKKRKIQKMFTTDVLLSFPTIMVGMINSFDKNLLVNFHETQTTDDYEFIQRFHNNPFFNNDNNVNDNNNSLSSTQQQQQKQQFGQHGKQLDNKQKKKVEMEQQQQEVQHIIHVKDRNYAIDCVCNSWIAFPDKIWIVSGAKVNVLKNKVSKLNNLFIFKLLKFFF
jgi:hypothetical protein